MEMSQAEKAFEFDRAKEALAKSGRSGGLVYEICKLVTSARASSESISGQLKERWLSDHPFAFGDTVALRGRTGVVRGSTPTGTRVYVRWHGTNTIGTVLCRDLVRA